MAEVQGFQPLRAEEQHLSGAHHGAPVRAFSDSKQVQALDGRAS